MKKKKIDFDKIDKEFDEHFKKCNEFEKQIKEERKDKSRYDLKKMSDEVWKEVNKK